MAGSTKVGPVVLQMEINGEVVPEYPWDMKLTQAWGQHDMFQMSLVIPPGHPNAQSQTFFKDNAPVKLWWGRTPSNILMWYGYVNHHVLKTNSQYADGATEVRYTFTGTSKVMNADQWKRWENTTPAGIAQTIAKKYSLRAVTTYVDWPVKYEVQAGESDFEFLNRMSQKYGYRHWVSGGTLYFIDPTTILHGPNPNYVPQYYADHWLPVSDTMRDFKLYRGDAVPGGAMTTRTIAGIDASTGKPFQVSADTSGTANPQQAVMQTARHVTSKAEAKRLINAQQNLSQFWQTGSATVYGYVLLNPNKLVLLGGVGVPNGYEGNWIVHGTEHKLALGKGLSYDTTQDIYNTKIHVVKNTTDFIPKISSYQTVNPEVVQCTLAGGVWQANSQSAITTAVVEPFAGASQ